MAEEMSTTETWCCTDCLMLLANGETPPEMSEEETASWLARVEGDGSTRVTLGRHTDVCGCEDWDTDKHRDECERMEFSWRGCDVCHSHLGGAREAVTFWFIDA